MSQEKILELREKLVQLDRKIKPLEWDSSRNQINEYRLKMLQSLKGEQYCGVVVQKRLYVRACRSFS